MKKHTVMSKIHLNSLFGILAALLSVSCTSELDEQAASVALREGEVSIQWLSPNMGIKHVKSRATDSKTAEEQKINNVHVFIFDADGDYLKADDNDAFQGYRYIEGNPNLVLQTNMFENQSTASSATIIAVANVPQNTFGGIGAQGYPNKIGNFTDLESFVYNLSGFTATLPETGLPMVGRLDNQNLSTNATNKVILIQMKSLMARIDLDFTMDPYQSSDDGRSPALRVDKVSVGNFPMGGTIQPQLDTEEITDDISLQPETEVTVSDFTGAAHTLREGEPQELTLYMFEHARVAKTPNYPAGIDKDEKQRYKNDLADEEAAYIKLDGVYTNHNGYKYFVSYTLYPGANAVDNFTIKANCQYKHNITVKGITVNNMGEEALLDTRVDIDSEDNPYFIEMLREREHDAHFNVTPMDVFIYRGGTVKVEIVKPEDHTWIRMEPIGEAATEAGYKKRDYFTENLLTDLDQQENSTEYTVTQEEERIYFYIDENVPTERNNGQIIQPREATLHITYTAADGKSHERDILIRQAGMLPVTMPTHTNQYGAGAAEYIFYIEYYEEYLNHYDGKDRYTHSYDGLEWGFMDIKTGLGGTNGNWYMSYGWYNTMTIMNKFRETEGGNVPYDITLNDKPRGATEYCYNKNKRNAEGKVEICHWYHPTIREIEHAMDRYYGTFIEFQNNWYWSSNPGSWGKNDGTEQDITWTGESYEHARATKSNYQGPDADEEFSHATSEADKPYEKINGVWDTPYTGQMGVSAEHEGGYARRNKIFRIRAAYIVDTPEKDRNDPTPPSIDNRSNVSDYSNN